MKDPKIDAEIDKNMNATLIITCGDCNRKTKIQFNQASPGKLIKCGCGSEFSLSGNDLRKKQRELDDLKRAPDKL